MHICTYELIVYIYVTCHAKTRPSVHFIIFKKNDHEHERSIDLELFIYHESTMTRGDTFKNFR